MPRKRSVSSPTAWRESIVEYIAAHPDRPLKARALARALGVADGDYADFRALIRDLTDAGKLALGPGRTVALPESGGRLRGVFRGHADGFGFVVAPERADVFVPPGNVRGALDGDLVEFRLTRAADPRRAHVALVTRVLERAAGAWVGVLERDGARYIVPPRGKPGAPPVRITEPTAHGARVGDLVVVDPHYHTQQDTGLRGAIVERLGPRDSPDALVRSVIRAHALADAFPAAVLEEAGRVADGFDAEAVSDREDLRGLLTLTIDPPDARDFDDAISIARLPDGMWELGVHIADVAHFVRPGSALDAEARRRGTSVYFPTRALPMLPEALSGDVCSLKPGEARLAKSVFMRYDAEARPRQVRLASSIIRSAARLTYDEALGLLAQGTGRGATEALRRLLHDAAELARQIRARRLRDGMIALDLPEAQLVFDARGVLLESRPAEKHFAHVLIEMCMVEANEAVCRELTRAQTPHLRRVHAPPARDEVNRLRRVLEGLGLGDLPRLDAGAVRALQERVRGRREEPVIHYLLLRAMSQARYSAAAGPHFALASAHYCHFTSPIRRYPDLVNHRALDEYAARGRRRRGPMRAGGAGTARDSDASLVELAAACSSAERVAQSAEREARALLQVQLFRTRFGEVFDALVLGVVAGGLFVQLRDSLVEGFVPLGALGSGWEFERDTVQLRQRDGSATIHLGLALRVRIEEIDGVRGTLRLTPVGRFAREDAPRAARGRPARTPRARSRGR